MLVKWYLALPSTSGTNPGSNPTGALCGLGFQSLLDCIGFLAMILLGFPPTSKTKTPFIVFSHLGSWQVTIIMASYIALISVTQ